MLQRLKHPHVLQFHGYGTLSSGNGFIVTELMARGSLRSVLADSGRDLSWATRLSIALQLALGMEHLHQVPIVHRDLKSANVLLDEDFVAKVADFGTSRQLRPRIPTVLFSSFTGVARVALPADSVAMATAGDGRAPETRSAAELEAMAAGMLAARGSMTKAAGTVLWMAPEVFRGDQNYGSAVDVYSFGVIMVSGLREFAACHPYSIALASVIASAPSWFHRAERALTALAGCP